ncbi:MULTISPECIES: helix-turn-helix transcriptional regulator [Bacillus]|uniref:helix-turn-helix transcriptional regulator n=1 Tax=Bacillus TaxID=1386 RepID=UPI0009766065|nr:MULTISPECIES: WYL domain-containing protein [Bacillus cereus group]MCC2538174.1 WYL domain-containing protein [Bacillus paranthracis]MCH5438483.1 WYL domain-containing protein [Bacillus paranthracis]MCM0001644.1 WYL domain-containing protein [Bacillus paranthracis]MCR6794809.1 WYL domain-containing protein [Bacillus paranthracis]MCU5171783.1 WYL domain-containing protein [Bacillus paranthracis]
MVGNLNEREKKTIRILSLYDRLCKGNVLIKKEEIENFGVHPKTIKRDLAEIQLYLDMNAGNSLQLEQDDKKRQVHLSRSSDLWLTKEEILSLGKVLLETRAFSKDEMNTLLDKIIHQSAPKDRDFIKDVMRNERHHYEPLQHQSSLLQMIWDISDVVRTKRLLEIEYKKETAAEGTKRKVKPVGILFSEYYFYLAAFPVERDFEFPTIYRMDRIANYEIQKEHFKVNYTDRFEEGEFRKKIQFMQSGPLMDLTFRFSGASLQAVLDRLPTARVVSQDDDGAIIEAKVFGKGIKMWLLSQGPFVEVLKPVEFRDEMRESLGEMLEIYRD